MYQQNMVERIEQRIRENKSDVKTYKAYETAAETGSKKAKECAISLGLDNNGPDFIPVYLPHTQRWALVFNLSSYMNQYQVGGYLGFFATQGFYSI